jgi:hypothetical protein
MADVVDAFLRGHQAGQSEREHNDALEDNKLRRLVLKHQMDQMKIEDQLRQRAIALENVKLQEGTPEADLTPATTQGGVLPSTPVPGVPAAAQATDAHGGDTDPRACHRPNSASTCPACRCVRGRSRN